MKTLRIVNTRNECVYVERLFFRRWWCRVTPKYKTNIEAYNLGTSSEGCGTDQEEVVC